MAKSQQFPVKIPTDFETLIRYEGRDINFIDNTGYSERNIGLAKQDSSVYANRTAEISVPVGKCYWVESISWGSLDGSAGEFQVAARLYRGSTDTWGLGQSENFKQYGTSGTLIVKKWFRELTSFQIAFNVSRPSMARFACTFNGIEFTGNSGLNFGANKTMLLCGASTSWYLIGDWRNNVDTYKYVISGSNVGDVTEINYMIPDEREGSGEIPFSGDNLWSNQLVYKFMEDGKDWRLVNKSFGGSNFIRNWYGALQSGYLNGVKADLIMIEAGANDASSAWTTERRDLFKNRLAKFTEWRNRWNPSAPVVYIAPVLLDDGFGIRDTNVATGSENPTESSSSVGIYLDPRESTSVYPSGSFFNTRCTWDSGSNGTYVSESVTYYMTRQEIARQLVREVATLPTYGGGVENNVYFIDGLEHDWDDYQVIYREEDTEGNTTSYQVQQGLRFAKYYRKSDIDSGVSGSITQWLKDNGKVDTSFNGIVGEINYYNSSSISMSPYNITAGTTPVQVIERDTQDLLFKYVSTGTNEQISGKRVHRSPIGMYTHYQGIIDKLKEMGLYNNL